MFTWVLVTAVLEATAVSSDASGSSWSRLWGGGRREAVLSANGEAELLNATSAEALHDKPECAEACDDYQQGVDKTSTAVCIDMYRTCAPAGCGEGLCLQRFMDECDSHCSEWADATKESLNVCQDNTNMYKCSGQTSCPSGTSRCKQKPIETCTLFCEGYEFSGTHTVSMDSEFVCQNLDGNNVNMGVCLPMPCSVYTHNSANYDSSKPCKQDYPSCANKCAAGSDTPNATSTCFDEFAGTCHNRLNCEADGLVRCMPTNIQQDLSNVDSDTSNLGDWQVGNLVEKTGKEAPKWSPGMTQTEWRNEQQRVRIAALRRSQQKGGKMIRRDG